MNTDRTYCSHVSCIHRRGCKRHLQNYKIPEPHGLLLSVFDGSVCADVEADERYSLLIRFRKSNGEEL